MVDDEELLVRINTKRLESRGYQVIALSDSQQGLEVFREQAEEIDLLITDQTMPGLTGTELAREILQIKPGLPVIMCTGHSDIITEDKALAMGISKYIIKPLRQDELLDVVAEVLKNN